MVFNKNGCIKALLLLGVCLSSYSQDLRQQVVDNIALLKTAVESAENDGFNVEKEKMTLRTSEIFLSYSDWDESNIDLNKTQYSIITTYRNNKVDKEGRGVDQVAQYVPEFEREQILSITSQALTNIQDLRSEALVRPDYRTLSYDKIRVINDGEQEMIVENVDGVDVPTFYYDYTFKPESVLSDINDENSTPISITDYHGNAPDLYVTSTYLNEDNSLKNGFNWQLKSNIENNTNISRVFIDHRSVPTHIANDNLDTKNDSKSVYAGQRLFIGYDIDNEENQNSLHTLLDQVVPSYKSKASETLGYMMANEPHWATIENDYFTPNTTGNQQATCDLSATCNNHLISYATMEKFEVYLKDLYGDNAAGLAKLNTTWFGNNTVEYLHSFDDIPGVYTADAEADYAIEFPIKNDDVGTPKVYDWFRFNNARVTDWFQSIHDKIKEHDAEARTHIKLIPLFFSSRATRDSGLDFEALQEIQEIIGNDADMNQTLMNGNTEEWMDRYNFHWSEMAINFDFLSSVKPNSINFNSENHYVSTSQFRDLYLEPSYVRAAFWLGYMLGENASHIWYWPREEDGSIRTSSIGTDSGYAASLIHQPAIVNEIGSVFYDMNAFAPEIYQIQNERKSIRVFHSETSAINVQNHMEHKLELYEKMFFDGTPIGFATQNIIEKQDNSLWDVIIVNQTPYATDQEINALQTYLNNGGTIIIDDESLLQNEYGVVRSLNFSTALGGEIISLSDMNSIRIKALEILENKGNKSIVELTENNSVDTRGCFWRSIKKDNNTYQVTIINMGKNNADVTLNLTGYADVQVKDLLTGKQLTTNLQMAPNDVLLLELSSDKFLSNTKVDTTGGKDVIISPNPVADDELQVTIDKAFVNGELKIVNLLGETIKEESFDFTSLFTTDLSKLTSGVFVVELYLDKTKYTQKIIKL